MGNLLGIRHADSQRLSYERKDETQPRDGSVILRHKPHNRRRRLIMAGTCPADAAHLQEVDGSLMEGGGQVVQSSVASPSLVAALRLATLSGVHALGVPIAAHPLLLTPFCSNACFVAPGSAKLCCILLPFGVGPCAWIF